MAVEYPRRGIWSIGFVTGESIARIRAVAEEPVLSVLMPTSPIPGTGFTISVRKSETVDLDIPVDQALQFVVSCGVVLPEDEMREVNESIAADHYSYLAYIGLFYLIAEALNWWMSTPKSSKLKWFVYPGVIALIIALSIMTYSRIIS